MTRALLVLAAMLSSGCMTAGLALDAVVGGVSIYQRYEDRQAQKDQTTELRALREAVDRNTEALRFLRPAP